MKLIIQIPCLNERENLATTIADLPRSIPGVNEIEVLVIDDGSADGTAELAERLGVHHIVRFTRHRGLPAAYVVGLETSLRLGADIIVNTDADNEYWGQDVSLLIRPIIDSKADMVVGDREPDKLTQFSASTRALQRWGSRLVRRLSGTEVADSTSGFRAMNRRAALAMFVHSRFSSPVVAARTSGTPYCAACMAESIRC